MRARKREIPLVNAWWNSRNTRISPTQTERGNMKGESWYARICMCVFMHQYNIRGCNLAYAHNNTILRDVYVQKVNCLVISVIYFFFYHQIYWNIYIIPNWINEIFSIFFVEKINKIFFAFCIYVIETLRDISTVHVRMTPYMLLYLSKVSRVGAIVVAASTDRLLHRHLAHVTARRLVHHQKQLVRINVRMYANFCVLSALFYFLSNLKNRKIPCTDKSIV